MKLLQNLRKAADLLKNWEGYFAICGGIAASLYREMPRYTGDIDIALIDSPKMTATDIASQILNSMGYTPKIGFITNQSGEIVPGTSLLIGREAVETSYIGIDFLLPAIPWVEDAVLRAQENKLDYGFAVLATVTPEDLIIAKLLAFQDSPGRTTDLDDITSIVGNLKQLNKGLILELLKLHKPAVPQKVSELLGL